jgi:gamma-glutamylcyclotransferase (GGCT)/AIG2-like uncharacterized protein YtfP
MALSREIRGLLRAANARRQRPPDTLAPIDADRARNAEERLDVLFSSSERLAVYGSLAPGKPNHHVLSTLGGTWIEGVTDGDLVAIGWGTQLGFPALRVRDGGPAVQVHVLVSAALRGEWQRLDVFEGPDYWRSLAPVWTSASHRSRRLITVANLYEPVEQGAR